MPLYRWKCPGCQKVSRTIAETRPALVDCQCGGKPVFVTGGSSMVMETLDNGVMARKLERLADVEEKIADRNALVNKPDDPII